MIAQGFGQEDGVADVLLPAQRHAGLDRQARTHGRRKHLVAVLARLLVEELPAGHRHDARRNPFGLELRATADLYRARALGSPGRLPRAYRSGAPWDGTLLDLALRKSLPRTPAGAARAEMLRLLEANNHPVRHGTVADYDKNPWFGKIPPAAGGETGGINHNVPGPAGESDKESGAQGRQGTEYGPGGAGSIDT